MSVIVPLHDHGPVVAETLDSILAQSHPPIELVVVDDGSADDGPAVVGRYAPRVRLLRQTRQGVAAARNRGLSATRGTLVVFFDADDLMPAGRLARQTAVLDADPALDGVFGDVVEFRPESGWRGQPRPGRLPGSLMLRRDALDRVGGFRDPGAQTEAIEWAARLEEARLALRHVPGVAVERRLHPGNHGHATDPHAYARVLKMILDRRRAGDRPPPRRHDTAP